MRSGMVIGLFSLAALSACGTASPAAPPVTVTVTPAGATDTSSAPVATPSSQDPTSDPPTETPDGPPVITGALTGPRRLTLSDVFEHQDWDEGSVAVPRVADAQQGIFTTVNGCGGEAHMELRFADQAGLLVLTAAQGLNSQSSHHVMEFQVSADGKLVDTKLVKFNAQQKLQADLSGVTAVTIAVKSQSTDDRCDNSNAVILGLSIVPKS